MMRLAFIAAFVLIGTIVAGAKGSTVKLTLTGPGFAAPVEIVEPSILDRSNVFAGSFIGETVDAAPQVKVATYTVSFDVQPPQNRPVKTAYAVSVARDARTGALWLYLPGRGEAGYRLNAGTILRDGQDGHWHRPSPAWASLLMTYLP
jgi:hypothetical protein